MTSRERFDMTLRHRAPDRVPIDLGATSLTGMRPGCQRALLTLLGFSGPIMPGNSGVDERIMTWAGTDFRGVGHMVSMPSPHTVRLENGGIDCWGIERRRVGGEMQIVAHPLKGATREDLADFAWPEPRIDDDLLAQWVAEAGRLRRDTDAVIIAEHPVLGIVELGCWMCGYDDFIMRLAGDPDFVRDFFDRILGLQLRLIEQYYPPLAEFIDITTSGDDFGMQTGPLMSPSMFEALVAPYFAERIARTKELGECLYWHHSCGSVAALMPPLIECGVDILNPVQTSAAGMDPDVLKRTYGDRILFWGAIDIQDFLRTSTPGNVRRQSRSLLEILGRDGGYVTAPAHEVQDDVPPENIAAWIDVARSIPGPGTSDAPHFAARPSKGARNCPV